jgi:HIV Tat-specific factor 1
MSFSGKTAAWREYQLIDIIRRISVAPPNSAPSPTMATTKEDTKTPPPAEVVEEEPPPGWGSDDRIFFDAAAGKYLLTEDDDSEMEWNAKYKAWLPVVSLPHPKGQEYVPTGQVHDEEVAAQQSAYSVAGVDESAPIERPKKRKKKDIENGHDEKRARQDNGNAEDRPKRERHPTAVYVSNLPDEVSTAEIQEYFAKCGMIAEDAVGQKRVKMYYDDEGNFKGDALVTYFKPESVPLALQMLDETSFPRPDGRPGPLVRVQLVPPPQICVQKLIAG